MSSGSFAITKNDLGILLRDREDSSILETYGGVEGVAQKLGTNTHTGLDMNADFQQRKEVFGENYIPIKKARSFWVFLWDAIRDNTLLLLCACAVLLLILQEFLEGGGILVAVVICSFVTAFSDYSKERQFHSLSEQASKSKEVTVIRGGVEAKINSTEVVVGDVVLLSVGDEIPTDGLFIDGFNISVNEASMTGEPFGIKKNSGAPFMLGSTEVTDGTCHYLVTNVGVNTIVGQSSGPEEEDDDDRTPLQKKLDDLVGSISIIGTSFALATFIASLIRWYIDFLETEREADWSIASEWLSFATVAITIIVMAVPEGLPLAVVISLAYSMKRMLKDNNFVRHLAACETMGGATNICSDKTGTLTENKMTVVKAWIAGKVYSTLNESESANEDDIEKPASGVLRDLISVGVSVNSSAFIQTRMEDPTASLGGKKSKKQSQQTSKLTEVREFVGNKSECALLILAKKFGMAYAPVREAAAKRSVFTFSSDRKRMSTVIDVPASMQNPDFTKDLLAPEQSHAAQGLRLYAKGASEIVLGLCTRYMDNQGQVLPLQDELRDEIMKAIESFASDALRTMTLAYRDLPAGVDLENDEECEKDLIFLGVCAIQDPLRREVPRAIRLCRRAGIFVRMVTGDNILTASAIARQCGILHSDGIAIEGFDFRRMQDHEVIEILPRLQVMARAQPLDKQRLVTLIKKQGEVVAVTGDGANDAPALKAADIGLAMGITGTDVAKNAAGMVILDDNFVSIVNAVMWGRCVYDNIRRFLQFQLTVNVGALLTAFIGAVATGGSPLTAIQLLWVNLIMDTLAALALATESPTDRLLLRPPQGRFESLISPIMWRNVIIQSIYQVVVMLLIQFMGPTLFKLDPDSPDTNDKVLCLIFNTFVFCQLFNEFNSRKVSNELNIFEGLGRAPMFMVIWVICVAVQVVIVFVGGPVTSTVPLSAYEWLICILFSIASIPLYVIQRFIPPFDFSKILGGTSDVEEELEKIKD